MSEGEKGTIKFPEKILQGRIFSIPEDTVNIVAEGVEKPREDQVLEMLQKFSNGDWGEVSEVFKNINDDYARSDKSRWSFWGKYSVGGTIYEVFGGIRNGEAETIHILSQDESEKLSKALMAASFATKNIR